MNKNKLFTVQCKDLIPPEMPFSVVQKIISGNQSDTGGLAGTLHLKEGARVMLTSNIDISDRLINGQIGTVIHLQLNKVSHVQTVYIRFDDPNAGLKKMASENFAHQRGIVPIHQIEVELRPKFSRDTTPVIRRIQFPLMLAWACTIHNVQGLTLQKLVVNFDLHKRTQFNNGQMCVALSRIASLDGFHIVGNFDKCKIKADHRATDEYQRLHHSHMMVPPYSTSCENSLEIVLLNARSLKKHAFDVTKICQMCHGSGHTDFCW